MSTINGTRPTTLVPGLGEVPSGPRSTFQDQHIRHERRRTQEVIYPDRYHSQEPRERRDEIENYFPLRQSQTRRRARSPLVLSKEEAVEEDVNSFPIAQATEPTQVTDSNETKREHSVELGEISGNQLFDTRYANRFQEQLAEYARSTRSDTRGSRRQDTSEGSLTRADVLKSRDLDRHRRRSRSPRRWSGSRDDARQSSRGSSMLLSDRHQSVDSGIGQSASSTTTQMSTTSPNPTFAGQEEEDTRCRCPIGYYCSVRSSNHLDCRPLVREPRTWGERRDQEAFDRHREAGSHGENFTTPHDLLRILGYINSFMVINPTVSSAAIRDILGWVIDMEDVTIQAGAQQNVTTLQVLPALTAFLSPANAALRRSKGLYAFIEEELTVLERKWGRGDFSGNIKRGLTAKETYDLNGIVKYTHFRVDKTWPFRQSALYFGAGDLVNGQIFESRAELQRDGVHAPSRAGICGSSKKGAQSILIGAFDEKKNEGYADIDMGEVIEYMGTALPDQPGLGPTNVKDPHMSIPGAGDPNSSAKPTAATQALLTSLKTKKPVRVIRSWKMCSIVTNKPSKGYRYDGLYQVVKATAMKEARQIWSFRLKRLPEQLPHQGPLRGFPVNAPQRDSSGARMGHFSK